MRIGTFQFGLTGYRCLVIGGGRGIGAAVLARLLEEGGVCHATGWTALDSPASFPVDDLAKGCSWSRTNVRDPDDVRRVVLDTVERWQGLDGMVYCPGIAHVGSIENTSTAAWNEIWEVNTRGFALAVQAALPAWRSQGSGCAVVLSSQAARRGQSLIATYTASKAALDGMVRALAVELAPVVRVNAVAPGIVMTAMIEEDFNRQADLDGLSPDDVAERTRLRIPLRRFQTPESIAGTVAFLLSTHARDITGQVLAVDGGMSA
jgi:NAD(P)-dependent dehydrogenase (short-subunit alcohol dehydrogenase family)